MEGNFFFNEVQPRKKINDKKGVIHRVTPCVLRLYSSKALFILNVAVHVLKIVCCLGLGGLRGFIILQGQMLQSLQIQISHKEARYVQAGPVRPWLSAVYYITVITLLLLLLGPMYRRVRQLDFVKISCLLLRYL